jgi:hypothetical protein
VLVCNLDLRVRRRIRLRLIEDMNVVVLVDHRAEGALTVLACVPGNIGEAFCVGPGSLPGVGPASRIGGAQVVADGIVATQRVMIPITHNLVE